MMPRLCQVDPDPMLRGGDPPNTSHGMGRFLVGKSTSSMDVLEDSRMGFLISFLRPSPSLRKKGLHDTSLMFVHLISLGQELFVEVSDCVETQLGFFGVQKRSDLKTHKQNLKIIVTQWIHGISVDF